MDTFYSEATCHICRHSMLLYLILVNMNSQKKNRTWRKRSQCVLSNFSASCTRILPGSRRCRTRKLHGWESEPSTAPGKKHVIQLLQRCQKMVVESKVLLDTDQQGIYWVGLPVHCVQETKAVSCWHSCCPTHRGRWSPHQGTSHSPPFGWTLPGPGAPVRGTGCQSYFQFNCLVHLFSSGASSCVSNEASTGG